MGYRIKTMLLLVVLTLLLLGVGWLIGLWMGISPPMAITGAFFFSILLNFTVYWKSHKWVLKLHGAEIVSEKEEPGLHEMVERLAENADLPKPTVAITDDDKPNAFATGRNPQNAVVAVTKGLIENIPEDEIEAILGHEMAHIKNRDMLVNTMAATIAGAIAYLGMMGRFSMFFGRRRGKGGVLALLALIILPIAAAIVRMSISRKREYGADEEGAEISGNPAALANALERIQKITEDRKKRTRGRSNQRGNIAMSHMYIHNPFSAGGMARLFSTHPPVEERVKFLRNFSEQMS